MAQLRNALRAYAFEAHTPATALEHLNRLAWIRDGVVMATLIYLVLDPDSGRVQLSSAGHLPPLQLCPDGTTTYLDGGRSVPLGVSGNIEFTEAEYVLEPGSTLLLYTDGLVEKRSVAIDVGLDQLAAAVVAAPDENLEQLCDRLLEIVTGAEDDVALLAIRSTPVAAERLELTLPAEPTELGSLRRALRRWLDQCDAGAEESYDIILACNEASANAIEHAYGPGDASVRIDAALSGDEVAIKVRDFGRWREARADGDGRGLHLIETLMDSVDIVSSPHAGTEVSMTRRIRKSPNGT
jgi:anti-sigma regulatory factor (Ser/Thr protein kinase)